MIFVPACLSLLTLILCATSADEVVQSPPAEVQATPGTAAVPASKAASIPEVTPTSTPAKANVGSEVSATEPVTSADSAPEKWLLRYQFLKDQKLRYQTDQVMTLDATVGEVRRIDRSEMRQRRVFTVLSVAENGAARMAMQFEHVWMKKKVDDQEPVEFDSAMKPADVPAAFRQVAHELRGSAPKYWLSNVGLSLHPAVQKPDRKNIKSASESKATALVEGETDKGKIQLTSGSASDSTVQEKRNEADPGSFLMTLPDQPVSIGDTWKETITVPVRLPNDIQMQVPILRTFRLESVENGAAKVSFRCSVETPVRNATVSSQLIQATPRGTVLIDISRGLMLRREMKYDESVFEALGAGSVLTSVGTNTEVLLEEQAAKQ